MLFESKLASMCLMPKVIDEEYLAEAEVAFLAKHAPNVRRRCDPAEANVIVYTHTYDSVRPSCLTLGVAVLEACSEMLPFGAASVCCVCRSLPCASLPASRRLRGARTALTGRPRVQLVMERVLDSSGRLTGFKLLRKCYRRRKPEMRSHSIKWVDDKSTGLEVSEPATAEDQRRINIAWGVVQHWLRHHSQARPCLRDEMSTATKMKRGRCTGQMPQSAVLCG